MATYRYYLRNREGNSDLYLLKIIVTNRRKSSYIPTNFKLRKDQWDQAGQKVKCHPQKDAINRYLRQLMVKIDNAYSVLCTQYEMLNLTAKEIAILLSSRIYNYQTTNKSDLDKNSFLAWYEKCMSHKSGRTKECYEHTLRLLKEFKTAEELSVLRFESIKYEWILEFSEWMEKRGNSVNTRGIHLRNLRHIFNFAIDNEVTKNYPFRRFRIKRAKTRKRNLKIDVLRKVMLYESDSAADRRYLDAFKLSFMLLGINMKDLCELKKITNGYIYYTRSKTKQPHVIKVEPEALELIKRNKGRKALLNYLDNQKDYRNFYHQLCKRLRKIRDDLRLPALTSYYARHSWSTIASKIGVSKDTISAALAHSQQVMADTYIEFDMTKVDEANRKVLDYVLYGKE